MPVLKRFAWVSTLLLFSAYIIFGKLISSTVHTWTAIVSAAGLGVVIALMLLHPLTSSEKVLMAWFRSDSVAFASLVAAAAFASILLKCFKIFLPIIMILFAEMLTRIDLQTAEYNQAQTLTVLVLIAWLGLGLGWAIDSYI